MKKLVKEDFGGVSGGSFSTPMNTPGVGNAVPSGFAAMTGAQQSGHAAIGSGDKWGAIGNMYTRNGSIKKKRKKSKKHKIKKLESYLSNFINKLNESELKREDINLDEIQLLKYNKLSNEQKEQVKAITSEYSPYLHANYKTLSPNERKNLQVAIFDNTVLGYFCPILDNSTDTWDVAPIKISEKFKNLGIAKKLMQTFFADKTGWIYIYDKNISSINVFTSIGFKKFKKDEDTEEPGWWYRKY